MPPATQGPARPRVCGFSLVLLHASVPAQSRARACTCTADDCGGPHYGGMGPREVWPEASQGGGSAVPAVSPGMPGGVGLHGRGGFQGVPLHPT